MRLTQRDIQKMRRTLPGLTIDQYGDPVPPRCATEAQIVATVNYADKMRSEDDVAHKFWIGHLINALPDPAHGERVAYCRELFGEHRGKEFYDIAWVVSHWSHNPRVGWKWGHYKASAACTPAQQEEYVRRFREEGITVRTIEQECSARTALKKAVKNSTWSNSEHDSHSTNPLSSYLYVEYAGERIRVPLDGGHVHVVNDDDTPTAQIRPLEEPLFVQFARCLSACPIDRIVQDLESEEDEFAKE